jgi:4-amino-4-deoxychorismate lyase
MAVGLPADLYTEPTEILFVRPLRQGAGPLRLHVLTTRRSEPETFPRPKSAQYMNSLIAYRELRALGATAEEEGLMLTADERLAEGVTSNLFLVGREGVETPSPAAHILAGITRNKVLELAAGLKTGAAERDLDLDRLRAAEAIFVTNSVRGIGPVREVVDGTGQTLWTGESDRHPIVRRLQAAYTGLQT